MAHLTRGYDIVATMLLAKLQTLDLSSFTGTFAYSLTFGA